MRHMIVIHSVFAMTIYLGVLKTELFMREILTYDTLNVWKDTNFPFNRIHDRVVSKVKLQSIFKSVVLLSYCWHHALDHDYYRVIVFETHGEFFQGHLDWYVSVVSTFDFNDEKLLCDFPSVQLKSEVKWAFNKLQIYNEPYLLVIINLRLFLEFIFCEIIESIGVILTILIKVYKSISEDIQAIILFQDILNSSLLCIICSMVDFSLDKKAIRLLKINGLSLRI